MKTIQRILALLYLLTLMGLVYLAQAQLYDILYVQELPFEDYLEVDERSLKHNFSSLNGVYIPTLEQEGIHVSFEATEDAYLHFGFSKGYYKIELYHEDQKLTEMTLDFQYVPDQIVMTGLEAGTQYDSMVIIALTDTDNRLVYFETLESMDSPSQIESVAWDKTSYLASTTVESLDSNITHVQGISANLSEYDEDQLMINFINRTNREIEIIDIVETGRTNFTDILMTLSPEDYGQVVTVAVPYQNFDLSQSLTIFYKYAAYDFVLSLELSVLDNRNQIILESSQIIQEPQTSLKNYLYEEGGNLYLKEDHTLMNEPLSIPAGYVFVLKAGQSIEMTEDAYLRSYSPLVAIGTLDLPITIKAQGDSQSGLALIQTQAPSIFEQVIFDNLANIEVNAYETTGAINFYESDVFMESVQFLNNRSEDGLNIVRSHYELNQVTFRNTASDAFDSDFSSGTLTNSLFENTGNDGFDASGSEVSLDHVDFINIGDKGMSIGEASTLTAQAIYIKDSDVGIAVKDGSYLSLDSLVLEDIYLGLVQYIKKSVFSHTEVHLSNLDLDGSIGLATLFQEDELLFIDDVRIFPENLNKSDQIFDALIQEKELR